MDFNEILDEEKISKAQDYIWSYKIVLKGEKKGYAMVIRWMKKSEEERESSMNKSDSVEDDTKMEEVEETMTDH